MILEQRAITSPRVRNQKIDNKRLVKVIITKFCYQMIKRNHSRIFLSLTRTERIRKKQLITWKEASVISLASIGSALILLSPWLSENTRKNTLPVIDDVEVIMTTQEEDEYYHQKVMAEMVESDFSMFDANPKMEQIINDNLATISNGIVEDVPDVDFAIQEESNHEVSIDENAQDETRKPSLENENSESLVFNPYMTTPEGIEYYTTTYSRLFGIDKSKLQEKIYNEYDSFCHDYETPEAAVIEMANEIYRKGNQAKREVKDLTKEEKEAILIHYGRIYQLDNEQIAECIAISRCENPRSDANNYGGQLDKDMNLIDYPNIDIGAIRHVQCYLKHLNRAMEIENKEIKEQMALHGNLLGINISYCTHNTPYTALYDEGWNLLGYQKNPYPQDGHDEYWYQVVLECKENVLEDYPWLREDKIERLSNHR